MCTGCVYGLCIMSLHQWVICLCMRQLGICVGVRISVYESICVCVGRVYGYVDMNDILCVWVSMNIIIYKNQYYGGCGSSKNLATSTGRTQRSRGRRSVGLSGQEKRCIVS